MIDAKGKDLARVIEQYKKYGFKPGPDPQLIAQGERQIRASQGRPIIWFFAEREAAEYVQGLFKKYGNGLDRIEIRYLPWRDEQ